MDISEAAKIVLVNNHTLEQLVSTSDGLAFLFSIYSKIDSINYLSPEQREAVIFFCESREIQEKFQQERWIERGNVMREWGELAS